MSSQQRRRPEVSAPESSPSGTPLDRVQAAFGPYDLSSVSHDASPGGAAAAASIGASAYTAGEEIVAPNDVGTLAHEAAHVVQQRAGDGSGEEATREAQADEVADAVTSGRSAVPLLDDVGDPEDGPAAPKRVERMKDWSSGSPAPVDVTKLTDQQVLAHLGSMKNFGAAVGRPPGSTIEYEAGDKAALDARMAAPGFGAASTASIFALLNAPSADLTAAATARDLPPGLVSGFAALYTKLSTDARVVHFGVWAASKIPYVASGGRPADEAAALLDAMNELRELDRRLATLPSGQTIDVAETAIAGTNQTADLETSAGAQIEVKTVRTPITTPEGLDGQLEDGCKKFKNAPATGGPYDVVVYASYQTGLQSTVSTAKGREGTTSTEFFPDKGEHLTNFEPTPPNLRPSSIDYTTVKDHVLAWLNTPGRAGADRVHHVTIHMENATPGGTSDFSFSRASGSAVWS